jgi:hypothetical protein
VSSFEFTKTNAKPATVAEDAESGLLFEYYEHDGSWRALPDFDTLDAANAGVATHVDLSAAPSNENFGLRFRGFLDVPVDGVYGFHLSSDDGSRLLLGGDLLVDNDGIHGVRERSGYAALEAGLHEIDLIFFQGSGGVGLSLFFDGPGIDRRELPPGMMYHTTLP